MCVNCVFILHKAGYQGNWRKEEIVEGNSRQISSGRKKGEIIDKGGKKWRD